MRKVLDKLIDEKADVDERTMQMLVLGLEYLRELVDEHMRVETVEKRNDLKGRLKTAAQELMKPSVRLKDILTH